MYTYKLFRITNIVLYKLQICALVKYYFSLINIKSNLSKDSKRFSTSKNLQINKLSITHLVKSIVNVQIYNKYI